MTLGQVKIAWRPKDRGCDDLETVLSLSRLTNPWSHLGKIFPIYDCLMTSGAGKSSFWIISLAIKAKSSRPKVLMT
jgi:hypothetical protein